MSKSKELSNSGCLGVLLRRMSRERRGEMKEIRVSQKLYLLLLFLLDFFRKELIQGGLGFGMGRKRGKMLDIFLACQMLLRSQATKLSKLN